MYGALLIFTTNINTIHKLVNGTSKNTDWFINNIILSS